MKRIKPDLTIKPDRLVSVAFNIVYVLIILFALFGSVKLLEHFLGFNILEMTFESIITTYEVMHGTIPHVLELVLEDLLTDALMQGTVIFTLFFLFTFNNRLEVYPDHLIYCQGFDKNKFPFDKVAEIHDEALFKNIGTIYIKLHGKKDSLKVVYVVNYKSKKDQLKEIISSRKKKSS